VFDVAEPPVCLLGGWAVHVPFSDAHTIDFPLLSDSDAAVAEAYGIRVEEIHDHREVAQSARFVIDPDRQVQDTWRSERAEETPDLTAVNRAADCHGDRCDPPDGKSYLF